MSAPVLDVLPLGRVHADQGTLPVEHRDPPVPEHQAPGNFAAQENTHLVRQRVTVTTLSLLSILPAALDLPAQEVIDLPGRDQPLDADFEEIFRVGVLEGEDWEMFAHVASVAFDASGNLYVIDGLNPFSGMDTRILVLDASGNFVREFGSMGEGPGEFNMPSGVAVMRDGTTAVEDLKHRAYQLFDANG